jgi:hypothetical protein
VSIRRPPETLGETLQRAYRRQLARGGGACAHWSRLDERERRAWEEAATQLRRALAGAVHPLNRRKA